MIRNFARLTAASFILAMLTTSAVQAQNAGTVTNHAFAIGKGAGKTGYTSLLCGAGQIALGQSSVDPICRTMSGDATIDAAGALAIGANKVTNSILRQSGALAIVGRSANSTGNVADIQATAASDAVLRESGSALGFGTIATGGIANNAVTDAKLRQGGALSLIGRSANSTGNVADISASAGSSCAFRESSSAIACGTLATAAYAANSVTNAKLAQMANATFKCRTTAGTGDPEDCTATQSTALLNAMIGDSGSGGTKGLVPAPGSGDAAAGKFLKADGTFAVPPGSGGSGMTDPQRQNQLLIGMYQSKSFGGYRRVVNEFYDGFKASDGINSGSSSNYTLTTAAGNVAPSVSTTTQTLHSQSGTTDFSTGFSLFDAATALTTGDVIRAIGIYSTNPHTFIVKIAKRNSAGNYDIVVSESFSHPGGGFVDHTLATDYTVPSGTYYAGAYVNFSTDSTTSISRAFKTGDITGTGQSGFTEDTGAALPIRVLKNPTYNSMVLITTAQTADSSVSNGRVMVEFDNSASPTLNTDLTVEVTCDGGTHWTSASLSSVSTNGQGGRKLAETVDQSTTGGTSFAARVKTFNAKNIPIYGLSLSVH